ncbi:MAG: AsmA family protein, partial [Flavobacterium sp.]
AKLDNIPVNAMITGNFSNPKITTDMKSAVSSLTTQLVNQQKEKLTQKGTSALTDLINKNTKAKDTTKAAATEKEKNTQDATKKASDLLNGLFKKKK